MGIFARANEVLTFVLLPCKSNIFTNQQDIRKILDSKEGCFNNNKIIDTKIESHEILATIFTGGGTYVQSHLKCGEEGVFKK